MRKRINHDGHPQMRHLVLDLIEAGLSEAQIGERIGLSQPQVHRLKTGEALEPKWSVGQKLIALHLERCGKGAARAVGAN